MNKKSGKKLSDSIVIKCPGCHYEVEKNTPDDDCYEKIQCGCGFCFELVNIQGKVCIKYKVGEWKFREELGTYNKPAF